MALNVKSLEMRRQSAQTTLDSRCSLAERNKLGQFATPNALAVEIARYVASLLGHSRKPVRFGDPAVGSGSFFSAALEAFGAERIETPVGVELEPAVCEIARELWSGAGLNVIQGDFTQIVASASRPPSPNLILANPPYVRHHHLSREQKDRLRQLAHELTGADVNGLAGLYVYFLLLATDWLEDDGIAAWLIPSEFMDVNYGAAIKNLLTGRVTLIRAHRFDPDQTQFEDALVSSVVLVFRKTVPPRDHAVEFSFGGTIACPHARELVPLDRLRESRKWTVYPSHEKNDRCISGERDSPTLADLFRIQRGIATGSNKFFVMERTTALRMGLPARFLRPVLPSPRHLKATVIESGEDGYPLLEPQLCIIDCDLPEHAVESRYPALWEYFRTADALGIKDRYLLTKRSPWYRQEQRQPSPFLCTYMGRGSADKRPFRFIWNRSAAVATNLYLMLYPIGGLRLLLSRDAGAAEGIHAALNEITGYELRGEGRVYGGGLHKIEPSELLRISAAPILARYPGLRVPIARQGRLFDLAQF